MIGISIDVEPKCDMLLISILMKIKLAHQRYANSARIDITLPVKRALGPVFLFVATADVCRTDGNRFKEFFTSLPFIVAF
jgi:hypothetical protein